MEAKKKLLAKIKKLDWSRAKVSLYLVKRELVHREASYDVLQVNADEKLRKRLRGIASGKIQQSNNALDYDFHTADLDDNLLGIATSDTDFQFIIDVITAEDEPDFVSSIEQLIDSWLYIARLDLSGGAAAIRRSAHIRRLDNQKGDAAHQHDISGQHADGY